MADVGKKTGKKTQAGRDVYETPEGEMVSEKSTTFEYKGKWINIPTIHGGKQYSEDQLIKLLDEGLIEPTSTHDELEEAIEAAQSRSDSLEFNKGGTPMEEQMELFEDGGLKDEGGMVDEESGNDVPVGSTKKEVRDDIPAMLSEGEFVLPADVVRYHGLEKIMQLRDEAKFGLKKMEAMGQMGNSDEATLDDDIPFGPADLIIVGAEPMQDEKEPREMAQGGMVYAQAGTYVPPATGIMGYQPSIYQGQQTTSTYTPPPSSVAPPTPAPSPAGGYVPKFVTNQTTPFDDGSLTPNTTTTQTAANTSSGVSTASTQDKFFDTVDDVYTTKEYINPETGERKVISFYQGNPVTDIPEGFIPLEDYESQTDDLESTTVDTTQITEAAKDDNKMPFKPIKTQDKTGKSLQELLDMDKTEFKKSLDQMKTLTTIGSALSASLGILPSAVFGTAMVAKYNDMLEVAKERGVDISDHMRKKSIFGGEKSLYDNLQSYDDKTGKLVAGQQGNFGDTWLGDLLGFDGQAGIQATDSEGELLGLSASLAGGRRNQSVDATDFGMGSTQETQTETKPQTQSEKTAAAKSATNDWVNATNAVNSVSTDDPKAWSDAIKAQSEASKKATAAIKEASGWGTDDYNPNWRDE